MALYQENTSNVTRVLKPSNGEKAIIDIINDYSWTLSPQSARESVPYVELTEYQQTTAQLLATLAYYYKQGTAVFDQVSSQFNGALQNGALSTGNILGTVASGLVSGNFAKSDYATPYQNRYIATPTGFRYKMPYFDSKKFARMTSFTANNDSSLGSMIQGTRLGQSVNTIGNFISSAINSFTPGKVGLLQAESWNDTNEGSYTISFDLLNTGTLDDIARNREFCYLFTYQNSPSRRNFFITDPVVIYEMYIPDVVHFPACYVQELKIDNIGNTQLISGLTIPEAFRINIVIKPLFDPSRNIMNGVADPSKKVSAILDTATLEASLQQIITNLRNPVTPAAPNSTTIPAGSTPKFTPPTPTATTPIT